MPFDPGTAANLSNLFRSACTTRLSSTALVRFEFLLQALLGIKNIRNVQLWTRFGSVQRNFINRNLGQYELGLRTFIAEKFVNNSAPFFPVKTKPFFLPATDETAEKLSQWLNDNWIREYTTRIIVEDVALLVEYSADSSDNPDEIDLESPEFEDLIE